MNRLPDWPDGADRSAAYTVFPHSAQDEVAAAYFEKKWGQPPQFLFDTPDGYLRAGPVPQRSVQP